MNNRASIFGAGMGIITVAVIYGVLANSAVNAKFAKSVAVSNSVLGVSSIADSPVITANPYVMEATNIAIIDNNQTSNTKRTSLKVSITNNTNKTLDLSPGLHLHLIVDDGVFYSYTAEFLAENETIGGPILAGKSMDLNLDFIIPKDSIPTKLELAVDAQSPYRISL